MQVTGIGAYLKPSGPTWLTVTGNGFEVDAKVCLRPEGSTYEWSGKVEGVYSVERDDGGRVQVAVCRVKRKPCDSDAIDDAEGGGTIADVIIDNPNGAEIEITVTNPPPQQGNPETATGQDDGVYDDS